MDARRFDRLVASLFVSGTRRGLLRRLAALPLGGMLAAVVADEGEAGRHPRRDAVSAQGKKGKGKGKKKRKKGCRSDAVARTCAGKCGTVTDNCGRRVSCGPCACGSCSSCQ